MRLQRALFLLCTFITMATITATPSATGVSMDVAPTSASVQVGATRQFTATVTGSSNTTVVWTVNNVVNGSAAVGTISNSGLYTAPAVVPVGSVSVKATSLADTQKSVTALVTVTGQPPISANANPTWQGL
jgi:hypothetical protein